MCRCRDSNKSITRRAVGQRQARPSGYRGNASIPFSAWLSQQDQQSLGGREFRACVFHRQGGPPEVLQSHPLDESIEDRQCSDGLRAETSSSLARNGSGGDLGRGILRLRRFTLGRHVSLLGLWRTRPPQGKRRRPRATHSWCAPACSAVSSNVLLKNMTSITTAKRRDPGCFHGPIAGRGKRFGSCWASNARRHSPGFEAPEKFLPAFSCCRSRSASTQQCNMESQRHCKGWWTLAAATCSENHLVATVAARYRALRSLRSVTFKWLYREDEEKKVGSRV